MLVSSTRDQFRGAGLFNALIAASVGHGEVIERSFGPPQIAAQSGE